MEVSSTFRTIAMAVAVLVLIGWVAYYWYNIRSAKDEIGSEIELAPNTSAPLPDEQLEGKRLETLQFAGVVFLLIIGLGLPLYWLREPGRQSAAESGTDEWAVENGAELYAQGFQCSSCHGADGGGGVAGVVLPIPLTDEDGNVLMNDAGEMEVFNINVSWTSPSLTDVLLRYSEDEVKEILIYGRQNSPMPAWGVDGGGIGTEQEIDHVVDFLRSIQIDPETAMEQNTAAFEAAAALSPELGEGELLFQQHCARCHTQGWQWAQNMSAADLVAAATDVDAAAPGTELPIGSQGGGAFGPRLSVESLSEQFLTAEDQVDFIITGADDNVAYGTRGLGGGQMPGYGQMLSEEQITAIVEYERSLTHEDGSTAVDDACERFLADTPEDATDAQIEYCTTRLEGAGQ